VYYCVDDFSTWPGLDGQVLETMERELIPRADQIVVASDALRQHLAALGRDSRLLTHGVDLQLWRGCSRARASKFPVNLPAQSLALRLDRLARPVIVFWGLVDRRIDTGWCRALVEELGQGGTLLLVGPRQAVDPGLKALDAVHM